MSRRSVAQLLLSVALLDDGVHAPCAALAADVLQAQRLLVAGPGGPPGTYPTVSAALKAARSGAVITIAPGRYAERLIVEVPGVVLQAEEEGKVELVWETQAPYESVVKCSAIDVVLRGLVLRHASKSVANNYGVYVTDGDVTMERCDVSSSTGTGVAVEGARAWLRDCRVHDCRSNGVAAFGGLEDVPGSTVLRLENCDVFRNRGTGVLAKSGAALVMTDSVMRENGEYGLSLQDADALNSELRGNELKKNRRGPVQVLASYDPLASLEP